VQSRIAIVALAVAAASGAAGCGGRSAASPPPPQRHGVLGARAAERLAAPVRVTTGLVDGLGRVLVDGDGSHTLYAFLPDARRRQSCVRYCTTFWVPLRLPAGQQAPLVAGGVRRSLVGTIRGDGGRVVTYAGWPLYRYQADTQGGLAKGQGAFAPEPCTFLQIDCALNLGGPISYALRTDGTLNRRKPGPAALGPS
jgi:predicted lipoprotein with Yx(FWY)xxD motif